MGSEDARIGNDFVVRLGNGDSPPVFADLCAAYDAGEVGEEKTQVDVTTYCDLARAFRNGLAEGMEIPLAMNYISGDEQSKFLYQAYKDDELVDIQILLKDSSPDEYFQFQATVRAWKVGLPIGERSSLTFTLKISGEVQWVTP